jgi:hypothetical protein
MDKPFPTKHQAEKNELTIVASVMNYFFRVITGT